jgi:8-oxo-dGTP diphosphatase
MHVAAAIIIRDGRVLACRRAEHKAAAGFWEFPGGKVEQGEHSHLALARELREELDLTCHEFETFDISETTVSDRVIRLETVICSTNYMGELSSTDHDVIRWVNGTEAELLKWAAPDLPALARLISERLI